MLLKGTLYISQNEKLNLAPKAKKQNAGENTQDQHGMTDFTIPRNKEANAVDVLKMFFTSVTKLPGLVVLLAVWLVGWLAGWLLAGWLGLAGCCLACCLTNTIRATADQQ